MNMKKDNARIKKEKLEKENVSAVLNSFYREYSETGIALISSDKSKLLDTSQLGDYTVRILPASYTTRKNEFGSLEKTEYLARCIIYVRNT